MGRIRKFSRPERREKWEKRGHKFLASEALSFIKSMPRWYEGVCSQQAGSAMLKRFEDGRLSDKKLLELLDKFGFYEHQPRMFKLDRVLFKRNLKKFKEEFLRLEEEELERQKQLEDEQRRQEEDNRPL